MSKNPLTGVWRAAVDDEIKQMGGDISEETAVAAVTATVEKSNHVVEPWPMEPPSSIPSISVLKWSIQELTPIANTIVTARSKQSEAQARVKDLESKLSSGVLGVER